MNITVISDTHNLHDRLKLESGDILVHCGDVTTHGSREELFNFLSWFSKQNFEIKIFIAGNHDLCLDKNKHGNSYVSKNEIIRYYPNLLYLHRDRLIVNGIKFYGYPYTLPHLNMAFNLPEKELEIENSKIPMDTDILITHGAPYEILDCTNEEENTGSRSLKEMVCTIKPKIHSFGHIHEGSGKLDFNGTLFINSSVHKVIWKGDYKDLIIYKIDLWEDRYGNMQL